MASSGPWTEGNNKGGITIGVTDYGVEAFGGDDWVWSASFDKQNSDNLVKNLREEFGEEMTLREILIARFGEIFSTTDFVRYCDSLGLKYTIESHCE